MNLNKAIIIGNLTRDPEIRTLPSGQPVASFGVATNRIWNNKEGQKQQDTQFHNIVLFGRLAEIAKQYLAKGAMVMIEGRIDTRSWQSQDGSKKYKTEIIGEKMQLGPRRMTTPNQKDPVAPIPETNRPAENLETVQYPEENINPEDIPF